MIQVAFARENARRYVYALLGGKPIEPPNGGWSRDEMLALSGACYWFAMNFSRKVGSDQHSEYIEADGFAAAKECYSAINFLGRVAGMIEAGKYDDMFDERIEFRLQALDDGGRKITPVTGFKPGWEEID